MPYINVSQTILRLKNVLFFKDFPYYLFVYLPYVIELYDLITTHYHIYETSICADIDQK